jgi:Fe-S oxidoreductase
VSPARRAGGELVLFLDTFTRAFRPELAAAALRVLADAGRSASLAPSGCCGLTWISTGQLGVARRILRRTVAKLDGDDRLILVLEPSCASALRTDLPHLLGSDAARRVAARIRTASDILDEQLDRGWQPPPLPQRAVLQTHCHEYATFGTQTQQRVLTRLGVTAASATGCCGLAGNFGFERDHYAVSMDVAQLALAPQLDTADANSAVLADGFSCQIQIEHLRTTRPLAAAPRHIMQLLDDNTARRAAPAETSPRHRISTKEKP